MGTFLDRTRGTGPAGDTGGPVASTALAVRRAAGAGALLLVLAACGGAADGAASGDPAPEVEATGTDAAASAGRGPAPDEGPGPDTDTDPDTDPAPDPDPNVPPRASHPFDGTHPDLDWPFADDIELAIGLAERMTAAFDAGNEAGFAFMAAHSWPDGFTADTLLACRIDEPTPTWAELDAQDHHYRFEIRGPIPVPGFQYPPTGEYPAESGLRPYLTYFVVERYADGEVIDAHDYPARVAIRPDGTAAMFPTCFEYLPGEFLAHRVTDGDVGGYTDAEAAGDVRLIMTSSPVADQLEVCGLLDDGDLATIAEMVLPYDIEAAGLRIPAHVLEEVLGELCAALRT